MHGGLSPDLSDMEQIKRIVRPTDVPDSGKAFFNKNNALIRPYMWSSMVWSWIRPSSEMGS